MDLFMTEGSPTLPILVLDPLHDDEEAVHALLCSHCWEFTGASLAASSGEVACLLCDGRFSVVDRRA